MVINISTNINTKKKCTSCHELFSLKNFYISKSPMFSLDGRVPICKSCTISECLNENGSINEIELNKICMKLDKPYYKDSLESAYNQFLKENSYINEKDVKAHGSKILELYFKNIAMRQTINKGYDDSESDGFIYKNSNSTKKDKETISKKYSDVQNKEQDNLKEDDNENFNLNINKPIELDDKDKQNMKYVISTMGYDPFENIGLSGSDKKYCFNILAGYCDTDGITEDGHKMQSVIEISTLYLQCKKLNEALNIELSSQHIDDLKVSKLTASKSSLLSSITKIAQDNNISSKYNKNSKQGQDSMSSKIKEIEDNKYEAIRVNLFDIKTSEAFKQIDEISNNNISNQLTLDNNEYSEIVKEQRELIKSNEILLETLKEENRHLKNKIIDLERLNG